MKPKEVFELVSQTIEEVESKLKALDYPFEVEIETTEGYLSWMRWTGEGWKLCVYLNEWGEEADYRRVLDCRIMDRLKCLRWVPSLEKELRRVGEENIAQLLKEVVDFRKEYLGE